MYMVLGAIVWIACDYYFQCHKQFLYETMLRAYLIFNPIYKIIAIHIL